MIQLFENFTYDDEDSINGVIINKPITINGNGYTLNGNKKSRILYILADNVTLTNINFINDEAYNWYNGIEITGGAAIFWAGANGKLINCTFTSNNASKDFINNSENTFGSSNNRGGAIVWFDDNGLISNSEFKMNTVNYPNAGGVIYVACNNFVIDSSNFVNNSAYIGAAISYSGNNLTITSSYLKENIVISGNATHGDNIFIVDSKEEYIPIILVEKEVPAPVNSSEDNNNTDVNSTDSNSTDNKTNETSDINKTVVVKPKIVDNKNLIIYFKSPDVFSVKVYGEDAKIAVGKTVKFTINKKVFWVKTNKNGVASLRITQKPGTYSIVSSYGDVSVKNTVTVKSCLITKNLTKKVKKSAKFNVKVLNTKGKAYAKQTVKIKFKGKTYKIKTNSKGISTLKLAKNIKAGKYTIKTTYDGLTNTNKVIVKK